MAKRAPQSEAGGDVSDVSGGEVGGFGEEEAWARVMLGGGDGACGAAEVGVGGVVGVGAGGGAGVEGSVGGGLGGSTGAGPGGAVGGGLGGEDGAGAGGGEAAVGPEAWCALAGA